MAVTPRNAAISLSLIAAVASLGWSSSAAAEDDGDFSIKPRGRLQLDLGDLSADDAVESAAGGLHSDAIVRRFFLGFDASLGDISVRAEVDLAPEFEDAEWQWTDAYIQWKASDRLTVTLGQNKPAWGLEEQTSDLFPTFMERAAIHTAFGNERRTGLSAVYDTGQVVVQGGAYLDDLNSIMDEVDQGHSYFGRMVYAPKAGKGRLHFGARINHRDLDDGGVGVRYSTRPFLRTTETRFANTGSMPGVTGETGYGAEFAYLNGPFHVTGEIHWQHVSRLGALVDPTFSGFYAEAGYFLTKGDTRGYKGGNWDRTKPKNPVGSGGIGAIQLNLRYDHLDLNDSGFVGGTQDAYAIGLSWTPTERTRLILNYARMEFEDAAISAGGDRYYGADAFGVRAQFDF